eukprot:14434639-Heterocapsa_arctica.AAC.1
MEQYAPLSDLLVDHLHGLLKGAAEELKPTRANGLPEGYRLNRNGCLEPKWLEPKWLEPKWLRIV